MTRGRSCMLSSGRTVAQSILRPGGLAAVKRHVDDANEQFQIDGLGCGRRDRGNGDVARLRCGRRQQRRYLSPAQSVRRRFRPGAVGLRRGAQRGGTDRFGHQRHVGGARSPLELHEQEALPGHAGADPRRVRRTRHRGHHGERPGQGGGATIRRPSTPGSRPATSSPTSTASRCRA